MPFTVFTPIGNCAPTLRRVFNNLFRKHRYRKMLSILGVLDVSSDSGLKQCLISA